MTPLSFIFVIFAEMALVPSTPTLTIPGKNRNGWSANETKIMKGIIMNEAKRNERYSKEELGKYFEDKSLQALAAKHRNLAAKMYETKEISVDVCALPSESGKFYLNCI